VTHALLKLLIRLKKHECRIIMISEKVTWLKLKDEKTTPSPKQKNQKLKLVPMELKLSLRNLKCNREYYFK